ncbi:DUF4190 domain-containing protein [Mycobacterium sp.]|uniref:DUF4190 domain-containing protein n=1 Tax=Mycobacterium sp. TaxID=1785 RepID=UPI00127B6C90|nr:DUF4190 domain-containing protein [Mycobacterium sp.]KAA8969706.1 MAG: DUF4190 domain-containing protein [Mycobacterium sp.]
MSNRYCDPYPPGTHPGYPPPSYPGYRPVGPRNGLGVASLVLAVAGLLSVWSVVGGIVLGVVGAVLGLVGWQRARRGEANNAAIAIAGIALGVLAVLVGLAFAGIWIAFWRQAGGNDYIACLRKAGPDHALQQRCADQFRDKVQDQFGVTLTPGSMPSPAVRDAGGAA